MSLLPLRALYVLSDIIYIIVRYILKYRRNIIRKNLQKSFPEKDEKDLHRIETEFYHYFCDYLVETIKMMTMSERQIRKRMVFTNMEEVRKILGEGQSVAFYLGHYGNWEWISSTPYWIQENVVYKLFPTTNMWNFVKLDTRNGKMWQVQYSVNDEDGYRGEVILNDKSLLPNGNGNNGRFTLIPTQNMYNFILLDQQNGKTWQVQWSFEEDKRLVIPISE